MGKTVEVLIDGENRGEEYPLTSRTGTGRLAHLKGDGATLGRFVRARITDSATWALFGAVE